MERANGGWLSCGTGKLNVCSRCQNGYLSTVGTRGKIKRKGDRLFAFWGMGRDSGRRSESNEKTKAIVPRGARPRKTSNRGTGEMADKGELPNRKGGKGGPPHHGKGKGGGNFLAEGKREGSAGPRRDPYSCAKTPRSRMGKNFDAGMMFAEREDGPVQSQGSNMKELTERRTEDLRFTRIRARRLSLSSPPKKVT